MSEVEEEVVLAHIQALSNHTPIPSRMHTVGSSETETETNENPPDSEKTTSCDGAPSCVADDAQFEFDILKSSMFGGSSKTIAVTGASDRRKLHLLVTDDSVTNRRFLAKLLSVRGHTVVEADDGSVAVELVKNSEVEFDAIFMDYVMPKMNGGEASTKIRELGYTKPIIGVTGNALEADIVAFLKAGATHVLTKPLRMPELLKIIDV